MDAELQLFASGASVKAVLRWGSREAPTQRQNVRVQGRARKAEARGAKANTITRFTAPMESVATRILRRSTLKATKLPLFRRVPLLHSPTSSGALWSSRDFLFSVGPNMQLSLFMDNVLLVL